MITLSQLKATNPFFFRRFDQPMYSATYKIYQKSLKLVVKFKSGSTTTVSLDKDGKIVY